MLHRYAADRAPSLVDRLAQVLDEVPADPMTPEWLATPSEGMRRWVLLELASRLGSSGPGRADGICANVVPAFADSLRRAVLATDRDADVDPWSPTRMAWSVLEVLADEPLAADLGVVRSADASRYGVARQIADHFDRYHQHRPAMVRAWAEGHDVDGLGAPVPDDMAWQPRLWRVVRELVGEPSAPERWPGLLDRLRRGLVDLDLPGRLLVFGFSLLPTGDFLELLSALAVVRDVHLFLLEPASYDRRVLMSTAAAPVNGLRPRADDGSGSVAHHPLLRSWGRPQRETAVLLAEAEDRGLPPAARVSFDLGEEGAGDTLLGRLQADVRVEPGSPGRPRTGAGRPVRAVPCLLRPGPTGVSPAGCPAPPARRRPRLREEDIVVLCPSLERFAPLIATVLGPSVGSGAGPDGASGLASGTSPSLRYRVVDQSVRTANDLVEAALALLDLVSGRFEAPAVVDFLNRPAVRERFGFDEDDVASIDRWVVATRVRWGIDPEHRGRFGLSPSVSSNTWRSALDRLLFGSVVDADELAVATGPVVPYAIEGGAVGCAGRLAEAVSCLAELAWATDAARPVAEWLALVQRTFRSLLATPPEMAWQLDAVERALADALEAAGGDEPSTVMLEWPDLRRLLSEHLAVHRGRNDFFRGGITITSLIPLRWVPFRVVCLLGMDQAALTSGGPAGDDLVQTPSVIGDRDPRSDVRQALLEAVLAAGDHLLVLRDGHNPRTNQEIPRAVATAELHESVLEVVIPPLRGDVSRRLEVDHPCHPFDDRCFTAGGLVEGMRWGFGAGDLDGARARRRRQKDKEPFLAGPLPLVGTEVIDLADLHAFFEDPTGTFLSERLGVRLPRGTDRPETTLPVNLDALSSWQVGDRLLRARLDGHDVAAWLDHELGLGTIPPGTLGEAVLADAEQQVEDLVRLAHQLGVLTGRLPAVSVDLLLDDRTRIVGTVPMALESGGPGAALVTYSRQKPGQRLRAWLDLMVLSAAQPHAAWRSVVVCRSDDGSAVASDFVLTPEGTEDAPTPVECLELAVELYRMGMVEPLPLFPKLSYALCHKPSTNLAGIWRSSPGSQAPPGEGESPAIELVHGRCEVDAILALPGRETDPGQHSEPSRARRLARSLFCTVAQSMRSQAEQKPKRRRR